MFLGTYCHCRFHSHHHLVLEYFVLMQEGTHVYCCNDHSLLQDFYDRSCLVVFVRKTPETVLDVLGHREERAPEHHPVTKNTVRDNSRLFVLLLLSLELAKNKLVFQKLATYTGKKFKKFFSNVWKERSQRLNCCSTDCHFIGGPSKC